MAEGPPTTGGRRALFVHPQDRAVVLGSAQRAGDADAERCAGQGWSVARRHSGGGAVVIVPGAQVWLDVFVPADDARAEADVVKAASWLGELWAAALGGCGLAELSVHHGGVLDAPFARVACFTGLGPGEVTWRGRKVVGCSQRRTRAGATLHTMCLLAAHQGELARLLALDEAVRPALAAALDASVGAVPLAAATLEVALRDHLRAA